MSDTPPCPPGAHSQVGELGEEKPTMKMRDNKVKMEMHAKRCGTPEWSKGKRDGAGGRGDFPDILQLVLTYQVEWLPNASEQIPAFTWTWVSISSWWIERELHRGGDA